MLNFLFFARLRLLVKNLKSYFGWFTCAEGGLIFGAGFLGLKLFAYVPGFNIFGYFSEAEILWQLPRDKVHDLNLVG